jgi:hypothetical protein
VDIKKQVKISNRFVASENLADIGIAWESTQENIIT